VYYCVYCFVYHPGRAEHSSQEHGSGHQEYKK
jgi:hypothetical protein